MRVRHEPVVRVRALVQLAVVRPLAVAEARGIERGIELQGKRLHVHGARRGVAVARRRGVRHAGQRRGTRGPRARRGTADDRASAVGSARLATGAGHLAGVARAMDGEASETLQPAGGGARRARGRFPERVGGVIAPPAPLVTAAGPARREHAMKGGTRVNTRPRERATFRDGGGPVGHFRGTKSRRGLSSARTSDGSRAGGHPRSACVPEGAVRTHSCVRPGRRGRATREARGEMLRALSDDRRFLRAKI